jgi:hypothetical protein
MPRIRAETPVYRTLHKFGLICLCAKSYIMARRTFRALTLRSLPSRCLHQGETARRSIVNLKTCEKSHIVNRSHPYIVEIFLMMAVCGLYTGREFLTPVFLLFILETTLNPWSVAYPDEVCPRRSGRPSSSSCRRPCSCPD